MSRTTVEMCHNSKITWWSFTGKFHSIFFTQSIVLTPRFYTFRFHIAKVSLTSFIVASGAGPTFKAIMNLSQSNHVSFRLAPNKRKSASTHTIISVWKVPSCRRFWFHVIQNSLPVTLCCQCIKWSSQPCHIMFNIHKPGSHHRIWDHKVPSHLITWHLNRHCHRYPVPDLFIQILKALTRLKHRRLPTVPKMVTEMQMAIKSNLWIQIWAKWRLWAIKSHHIGPVLPTTNSIVVSVKFFTAIPHQSLSTASPILRITPIASAWVNWVTWTATAPSKTHDVTLAKVFTCITSVARFMPSAFQTRPSSYNQETVIITMGSIPVRCVKFHLDARLKSSITQNLRNSCRNRWIMALRLFMN